MNPSIIHSRFISRLYLYNYLMRVTSFLSFFSFNLPLSASIYLCFHFSFYLYSFLLSTHTFFHILSSKLFIYLLFFVLYFCQQATNCQFIYFVIYIFLSLFLSSFFHIFTTCFPFHIQLLLSFPSSIFKSFRLNLSINSHSPISHVSVTCFSLFPIATSPRVYHLYNFTL